MPAWKTTTPNPPLHTMKNTITIITKARPEDPFEAREIESHDQLRASPEGRNLSADFAPLSGECFTLRINGNYSFHAVTSRAEWERLHGPVTLAKPDEADAHKPLHDWPFPASNRTTWTRTSERAFNSLRDSVPHVRCSRDYVLCGEAADHTAAGVPIYTAVIRVNGEFYARELTVKEFDAITNNTRAA